MRANERMNTLANNGIDTSKFFTVTLDRNVANKGIVLKLDGDDLTVSLADEYRELREQIDNNGTVACSRLYRRWICAQMLRIQKGIAEGKYKNIEDYMSHFTFKYMSRVLSDELKAMIAIGKNDDHDTFDERSAFYTWCTIAGVYDTWVLDLERKLENSKIHIQNRNRWDRPHLKYITIGNRNFYVEEIEIDIKKMKSVKSEIYGNTYDCFELKRIVNELNRMLAKYDNGREQIYSVPTAFMDAYKASGAYYTLKNLVLFHNANLVNYETGEVLSGTEAFEYLKTYQRKAEYKVYALMKDCLKQNNIRLDNLF